MGSSALSDHHHILGSLEPSMCLIIAAVGGFVCYWTGFAILKCLMVCPFFPTRRVGPLGFQSYRKSWSTDQGSQEKERLTVQQESSHEAPQFSKEMNFCRFPTGSQTNCIPKMYLVSHSHKNTCTHNSVNKIPTPWAIRTTRHQPTKETEGLSPTGRVAFAGV